MTSAGHRRTHQGRVADDFHIAISVIVWIAYSWQLRLPAFRMRFGLAFHTIAPLVSKDSLEFRIHLGPGYFLMLMKCFIGTA
jgi:hypothetical protein